MDKLPKNQKYFYDIEIKKAKLNKAASNYIDPGEDYLPYAVENKHMGSNFDDFLAEEGLLAKVEATAIKRVIAYQIEQELNQKGLTKTEMAKKMKTSRSSLDRLLDPENASINLQTITKATSILGKRLKIEFV